MAGSFQDDIRHPDYKGPNPFADDVSDDEGEVTKESLYAANEGSGYVAEEYEISVSDRGSTIIVIAACGTITTLLGILSTMTSTSIMCLPMPLFALGLTVPSWLMGRHDLAAMRAGAMSSERRGLTWIGFIMGFVGTVMALGTLIVGLWQIAVTFLGLP